ncbi:helix-turn-helix domain-containing protein [Gillisia limnaea]|uniref:Transcriptional regulator, AraC family n=1 Tax=Gillisia limnaea (strain DSM 15749 / LMG 21470 / R-8282) TaxID=865937 RepID=H2BW18_GILLR|nr:helix-turn-helix domain-containing protein [Gillisia limnaea]EHQ02935.1 transcriptional regulator, AraC family [Gillisia limnaea DSM 15749]
MDNQLSMDEKFLKKLVDILETNLENEQFGVGQLATAMGLSRSQLHRKLNAINGKSTSRFIREFRLEKAMEMLKNNVATASEIAYKVGFSSPSYFNTSFNQYYGYPPGEVKFRNPLNDEDSEEIQTSNDNTATLTSKSRLFNKRTYVIATLAILLIASFSYYNYTNSETTIITENEEPVALSENSIAVLPFKNMSGSPENEAFCDGMTTAIISRLSKIKGINKVISLTSMMNYKDNKKSMQEIAKELKVRYILESGFQKSGNDIKINLQLIDGKSDKLFWSQEYKGTYDSIFKVQALVAEMVAKKLDANITEEEQTDIQQAMTKNMEAYDNYLQGVYVSSNYSAKNYIASRKYFERAIALDSSFAEAYVRLGYTYSMLGTWFGNLSKMKADSLAAPFFKKALQLDPNNLELLYRRAEKELFNWNFKVADSMLNEYTRHMGENFLSDFLYLMLGRYDEVIESINNQIKEDPNALYNKIETVYAYYFKGDIETSLHLMNKGLMLNPNFEFTYDHFGNIYIDMKNYEKAKDVLETGLQISDKRHASMLIHLAIAYHYLGNEKKSLEYLNEVIDRANKGEPEIIVFVAHYYARLGKNDEAFKWLDKAYKKHEVDLIWLKADPNLLMLKNDPRYKVLCNKIGFPDC